MREIRYARKAARFLRKASKEVAKRLLAAIQPLSTDPFSKDAIKVRGTDGKHLRIRVGDYRVLYEARRDVVLIVSIDKRSRIYKR